MDICLCRQDEFNNIVTIMDSCTNNMISKGIYQWDEDYPTHRSIQEDIERQQLYGFKNKNDLLAVITLNDDQPSEYLTVNWRFKGKVLVIHRLAVLPSHQNQGIATKLMDFAYQYAGEKGYQSIRLDAYTQNPSAIALYEGLGYKQAGQVIFRNRLFECFEKEIQK